MRKRLSILLVITIIIILNSAVIANASSDNGLQDYKINGEWVYLKDGQVAESFTGLAKNQNGWFYVNRGSVDFNFNGIVKNQNGYFYVKNGKVDFDYNGVEKNENGWWKITRGKVDFTYTGLAKNRNGWFYVRNGKVDFNYNGIVKNENGFFYVKSGKVDFNYNGVEKNDLGWWKITNGKVDFKYTGLAKNKNGWWYLNKGKVDFTYTDFADNENGWWYVKNGKIDLNTTGVFKGHIKNQINWWHVKNSKIRVDSNGNPRSIGEWFDIVSNSKLQAPLEPGTYDIYSGFGYRGAGYAVGASTYHRGMDFAADPGTKVLAAADGKVIYARYKYSYGYTVIIDHGEGIKTLYCHGDRTSIVVKEGDEVKAGQVITHVGDCFKYGSSNYIGWYDGSRDTGTSSMPHLHFSVYLNDVFVDPAPYLGLEAGAKWRKYVVEKNSY